MVHFFLSPGHWIPLGILASQLIEKQFICFLCILGGIKVLSYMSFTSEISQYMESDCRNICCSLVYVVAIILV